MSQLVFQGESFLVNEQETVLECLLRHGVTIPNSCRSGICQSCLMRATSGSPGTSSQKALKSAWCEQGYFLACSCVPDGDLELAMPDEVDVSQFSATIVSISNLNEQIVRVLLRCDEPFEYRAGQFVNLCREDGLQRSYSLASVATLSDELELHVKKVDAGKMSGWLHDEVKAGEKVSISAPHGECYYASAENNEQGLMLLGTGSGLAPLWGVVQDALHNQHQGPILLFHGGSKPQDLYLVDELTALAEKNTNLRYFPCLLESDDVVDIEKFHFGSIEETALNEQADLAAWSVFLCGNPAMVNTAKRRVYLAGASLENIHSDPFVTQADK